MRPTHKRDYTVSGVHTLMYASMQACLMTEVAVCVVLNHVFGISGGLQRSRVWNPILVDEPVGDADASFTVYRIASMPRQYIYFL